MGGLYADVITCMPTVLIALLYAQAWNILLPVRQQSETLGGLFCRALELLKDYVPEVDPELTLGSVMAYTMRSSTDCLHLPETFLVL